MRDEQGNGVALLLASLNDQPPAIAWELALAFSKSKAISNFTPELPFFVSNPGASCSKVAKKLADWARTQD